MTIVGKRSFPCVIGFCESCRFAEVIESKVEKYSFLTFVNTERVAELLRQSYALIGRARLRREDPRIMIMEIHNLFTSKEFKNILRIGTKVEFDDDEMGGRTSYPEKNNGRDVEEILERLKLMRRKGIDLDG